MKVRFTALAHRDVVARAADLIEHSPAAADDFRESLDAALRLLAARPRAGRPVELRGLRRPVRRWVLAPMVVYYAERDGELVVYRVRHERRRPIEK